MAEPLIWMDWISTFDPGSPVVWLRFTGTVDGRTLAEATQRLYEDPRWRYGADVIWDFTLIRQLILSQEELAQLPELDQLYRDVAGPGRDVLVAVRETDYAIARFFQRMTWDSFRRVEVCRSFEEARLLLELPPEALSDGEGAQ